MASPHTQNFKIQVAELSDHGPTSFDIGSIVRARKAYFPGVFAVKIMVYAPDPVVLKVVQVPSSSGRMYCTSVCEDGPILILSLSQPSLESAGSR